MSAAESYGKHSATYEVVADDAMEPKVKSSAAAGAGAAAIITPAVVLAVDTLFYGGGAIDVPLAYVGVIGLIVTGVSSLVGGYLARHVNRAG